MKRLLLAIFVVSCALAAQTTPPADADTAAIRQAAELYVSADPENLRKTFYETTNLYSTTPAGELRIIPFPQYLENVIKNAGSAPKLKMSIDSIDRTGDVAVVKVTGIGENLRVTDYLSMVRTTQGWKIASKTYNVDRSPGASAVVAGSCPDDHIRALDFLVGDWKTADQPAQPMPDPITGASKTEKILNGCVIWERRSLQQKGKELFSANVYWGYDVVKKQMLLFYLDDHSRVQVYEGRLENQVWAFYRERPDDKGQPVLVRIVYAPSGRGFTQTAYRSNDQGKTWDSGGVAVYEPKTR